MSSLWLILGIVIGFLLTTLFAGKKVGKRGNFSSLMFNTKNYTLHLHHWLLALIIIIVLFLFRFYNDLIYGLLAGIVIQGLTYKDFYRFVSKKKKLIKK